MLTTLQGIYRNGAIVLSNNALDIPDNTPITITFLGVDGIDLLARGINNEQAQSLHIQLTTFSEEWDSPEMSIYDNYSNRS